MLSCKAESIKPSSTLFITAKANELRSEGIDVIGFGAGEPDFDTPDHIKEAAIKAINDGFTKYTPASGITSLKRGICDKLSKENNIQYDSKQIIVSNGAKHSLTNAFMAILNIGDEVIIPAPFWLSYPQMVKIADGVPVIVKTTKEQNYKVTVEQLKNALTDQTKAIVLNSPSNPTGMTYTRKELEEIAAFVLENNLYVISDEIYEKLLYDDVKHISIASLGDEIYDRTIVINGVSKSYAMTGWRIGYTASNKDIAKLMYNIQSHSSSNPNSIAQKAAEAAITCSQECVEEMKKEFAKRRDYMYERVKTIPLISALKPQGAFYLFIDITEVFNKRFNDKKITSADELAELLLTEENVAVIPCNDFGYNDHIRLSYAISLKQIEEGLNRIEKFLNKLQ
ncbi:L-aspartate aminotransferase [Natranaerovirga hydrolytica]|uniref:Aminotransferase n=1 Tax=Natranaerovirga hydrolytica TaxID=680378 RepID=A0A4R1N5R8_9FIRM|nr:pyridoxal phosphate-dependent aminotransferase [Natranaerovirga hydrolytica]TCK97963.1 L-aspartate aminotransferase [Natranaerovirga hydrolytica]